MNAFEILNQIKIAMTQTLRSYFSRVTLAALFIVGGSYSLEAQSPDNGVNCQDWVVYYANILDNDVTDIYQLNINGNVADMTLLATSQIEVHIAYNDADNLIYAVHKEDGSYRTLNPHVMNPEFSETNLIDADVSGVTATAFSPDGDLYIGDSDANKIYIVDLSDNSVTEFADAPVSGGDLEFDEAGNLYLASRDNGGQLILIGGDDNPIGSLPRVTGMALSSDNRLLASHDDMTDLHVRNLDGSEETSISLFLEGDVFETNFGDMASGCDSFFIPNEGDCQAFNTYYMDNQSADPTLYSLSYSGTNAVLTPIYSSEFRAHIAYDADNEVIYLVNRNGNNIHLVDPVLGFLGEVLIEGGLNGTHSAVFNPVDDLLYIGSSSSDEIYTVDPVSGMSNLYAETAVQGGDLAIQDGVLFLAVRNSKDLYEVVSPTEINLLGEIPSNVSGMAQANNNTSLVISKGSSNKFIELDTDGSTIQEYTAVLSSGAPFTLAHGGDMAAGCADPDQFEACGYALYYTHEAVGGGGYTLYGVNIDEDSGIANLSEIEENIGGAHIALSPDASEMYVVSGGNVRTYTFGVGFTNDVPLTSGGSGISGFPAAATNAAGQLFIAGNGNKVYQVNPADGTSTLVANISVSGGDLIFAPTGENGAEELWIITRGNNTFTRVLDPGNGAFSVDVEEMNGAAVLPNGNVLVADGDQDAEDAFIEIDLATQMIVNAYDASPMIDMYNGDLAGTCTLVDAPDPNPIVEAPNTGMYTGEVSTYPNPTEGLSQVVFETGSTAMTTLEVYDMSGRSVATIFNGIAVQGVEYRADFDGTDLPNGVYVYRLTNENETIIEKFMIAR